MLEKFCREAELSSEFAESFGKLVTMASSAWQ